LRELVGAAGRGQRRTAHVPAEVELVVVDPHRVRHRRRGGLQPLAIARDQVQPLLDALAHARVFEPRPSLEDEQPTDADRHRPLLGGQRRAIGG
jgi:hypothetical protein